MYVFTFKKKKSMLKCTCLSQGLVKIIHSKMTNLSSLLALKSFQTCVSFSLQLSTKEDILKNFGRQTIADSIDLHSIFVFKSMAIN